MTMNTNTHLAAQSSSLDAASLPTGAPLSPPQAGASVGFSFNCPAAGQGGEGTGQDMALTASTTRVHSGKKTRGSISKRFPEARGGRSVLVRSNRLCKADIADSDSHGLNPSASRSVQDEDDREGFPWVHNRVPKPEREYPRTRV